VVLVVQTLTAGLKGGGAGGTVGSRSALRSTRSPSGSSSSSPCRTSSTATMCRRCRDFPQAFACPIRRLTLACKAEGDYVFCVHPAVPPTRERTPVESDRTDRDKRSAGLPGARVSFGAHAPAINHQQAAMAPVEEHGLPAPPNASFSPPRLPTRAFIRLTRTRPHGC
jgi:hypothetical protein